MSMHTFTWRCVVSAVLLTVLAPLSAYALDPATGIQGKWNGPGGGSLTFTADTWTTQFTATVTGEYKITGTQANSVDVDLLPPRFSSGVVHLNIVVNADSLVITKNELFSGTWTRGDVVDGRQPVTSLDDQACAAAKAFFDRSWSKYGDYYLSRHRREGIVAGNDFGGDCYEKKGEVELVPRPMQQPASSREHGSTWDGKVSFISKTFRTYYTRDRDSMGFVEKKGWTDWMPPAGENPPKNKLFWEVGVQLQGGMWLVRLEIPGGSFTKVTCDATGQQEFDPAADDAKVFQKTLATNTGPLADRGQNYAEGIDQPKDYDRAMQSFRQAADRGESKGMLGVGTLYAAGHGVPQDYDQAMTWFRKAADAGNTDAMVQIAILYHDGHGVIHDDSQTMAWDLKAADAGNADAMYQMGLLYQRGTGVEPDDTKAVTWFRMSAQKNKALAMFALGGCYEKGRGVPQDSAEAAKLCRKAAQYGCVPAMYQMGILYSTGLGVPLDMNEARVWMQDAVNYGSADAKAWLDSHPRSTTNPSYPPHVHRAPRMPN